MYVAVTAIITITTIRRQVNVNATLSNASAITAFGMVMTLTSDL